MNRIVSPRSLTPSGAGTTRGRRPVPAGPAAFATLVAGLVAWLGSPASAATYYVDRASATCSNSGAGTEAVPYCTITAAVNARGLAGNTILVKPGTYREQVSINASGASGSPLVVQAFASGVVISGADDFSSAAQWTLVSGNVWLASSVNWYPKQVFLDGARCDSSALAVTSLTPRTFRWVSGTGLYVNAGGGNPASHAAQVGRRNYGFSLFGRSWITIDGFNILHSEDRGVYLNGSCTNVSALRNVITYTGKMGIQVVGGSANRVGSNNVHDCMDHGISFTSGATNCIIEDNESYRNARPIDRVANGIYLFGCPGNTIRQNRTHDNEDTGIHIQSGSNNCIQYLNRSWNNGDHGFDHLMATGTIHNGDVAYGNFKDGFSIEGNATGTQLHNCIAVDNGLTTNEFDLWVDSGSTTGFVSDYNIFWNSTIQPPVKYIATLYPTVAAYSTASGKDAHTLQANPLFVNAAAANFHLQSGSPAIDNANSGSPNWPTLDADDLARFNASGVPNNGVGPINYGDRGAYEFRTSGTNQAPNGVINTPTGAVTIIAGQSVSFTGTGTDSDNDLPLAYAWNFAGGAPNSSLEDPGAVVFNVAGTYNVSLTVTDALGLADPTPDTRTITVTANTAPNGVINTPTGAVTIAAGQSVNFTGTGSDANNNLPLTYFWNFGGGATNVSVEDPGAVVFATGGTYTVTFVVTDALGLVDPTPDTRVITVTSPTNQAPNGVINTPTGPVTIIAGQSVNFTGTGTDPNNNLPLTFAWNFGGGATNSTVEDPGAVVFATAGTYTVSFTVRDGLGLADPTPDTRTITVTANTAPNGVINTPTGAVTIAAGQSVNFTGTGSDANNNLPLTFAWNFGGGAANSTVEDPGNVVFANGGTFTVSFTATDALGLADPTPDTRVITVTGGTTNQAPNGVINTPAGATTITAGGSVNFTGTGTDPDNNLPLTFAWNFGGGAANSTVEDPGNVVFANAGTYTVSFTVRDGLGLADATPDSRVITVNPPSTGGCAQNLLPNPSFESGVTNWKGNGATLSQVAGGSVGSFSCRVTGPASTSSFYIQDDPRTISNTTAGSGHHYSAMVRSELSRGSIRIRVMEYLNGTKVGQLDSPALTLSANWQRLDLDYTPVQTGAVIYFTVKSAPVAVSETFDMDDASICALGGPPANQAPNGVINTPAGAVTIAAGQSVSFTGTGSDPDNNLPLTFAWNFGGGATNSTVEDPGAVVFANAGTYTVTFTVRDGLGLADPTPDTRTITVTGGTANQAPNGVINTPAGAVTITAGQSVSFTGTGSDPDNNLPLAFAWNFGGGATNSTVEDPGAVVFANAGTFTVSFTVTDGLGLADPTPDTRVITVTGGTGNQAPNGVINTPAAATTITAGQSVDFTGTGSDPDNNLPLSFAWNFGGGAANSTVEDPGNVAFANAGTYTVSFTVRDGLGLADPTPDTRVITVNPPSTGGCSANLLPNPSFESGLTGWKGVGATIAQVAGGSAGSFACRVTGAASTSSYYVEDSPRTIASTTAGVGYSFAASVRSDLARGSCRIRVMEYLNGSKVGQLDSPAVTLSTSWQQLEVSYTPVQTGSELYFTVKNSPLVASEVFDVDDCSFCPLAAPARALAEGAAAVPGSEEIQAVGARIKPFVAPNPMVGTSVLKFSTTRPGPLRVGIFDVSGRRVRNLVDDSQSPAGLHILPLTDRGESGSRLESGIYFYRIRSADGVEQGRFLIMN